MVHAPDIPRKEVADEHCWNLSPLFASREAWQDLYQKVEARIPEYESLKGRLDHFDRFLAGIIFDFEMGRDLDRLFTWAHLKNDQDKSDAEADGLFQRAVNLSSRVADASSFMVPEIQAIGEKKLASFIEHEALHDYRFFLEKLIRQIPHTRTAEVEQVLAMAGEPLGAPRQFFGQLDNADLNFGKVTDEKGGQRPLTHGNFTSFLSRPDRSFRQRVFEQYYRVYDRHKHSIAAALAASVKKDLFLSKVRNFDHTRQAALFADNVPGHVYDNLVETVKQGLPSLFRYLDFRKKALGLAELRIYDTYVPMVPDVDFRMPYEQAVETCIEALSPLGEEYCRVLEKGLTTGRWVDRYENRGKRSGAYSSGCYDSNPYILMNYDETAINSLFTLIHEAGHSMHTWYANRTQPYATSGYTIFVAEVASTLNETLLSQHLLDQYHDDPRMNAYILNREIDNIRATFFRQTMFAEFENIIHGMAAENQALTVETFTSTYAALLDTYFGKTLAKDDALNLECLRIPHFYSAFYVYKYATGLSAALAIAGRISEKGTDAVEAYLSFLKLGGAMFPIDELRVAGVDMTAPDPVNAAAAHFEQRVRQMEAVWESL